MKPTDTKDATYIAKILHESAARGYLRQSTIAALVEDLDGCVIGMAADAADRDDMIGAYRADLLGTMLDSFKANAARMPFPKLEPKARGRRRTKEDIRAQIRRKTCDYRECGRPRVPGFTMCPAHRSAGTSILHLRMLMKTAPYAIDVTEEVRRG